MHPAYSVIFFTTASGVGYGMLILIGILNAFGYLSSDVTYGIIIFLLSLGLITCGLLASTFHLGHPERAWRALKEWRSSWLSREGVMALLTYIPACLLAINWIIFGQTNGVHATTGLISSLCSILTVYCTAMIYASLKAIPAWNTPIVPTNFLLLSVTTGCFYLNAVDVFFGQSSLELLVINLIFISSAAFVKIKYWNLIDNGKDYTTIGTATGLGALGKISVLENPHSSKNYLQREMGFKIARKHSRKLRKITIFFLFILPILLIAISIGVQRIAYILIITTAISGSIGIVIERWLFFAEAKHVVANYYNS